MRDRSSARALVGRGPQHTGVLPAQPVRRLSPVLCRFLAYSSDRLLAPAAAGSEEE